MIRKTEFCRHQDVGQPTPNFKKLGVRAANEKLIHLISIKF